MITSLAPNQIFVFGSNANGIHAGGAALQARKFGALYGACEGPTGGQTYGIVTLDRDMNKVLLLNIREQAEQLKFIAQANPDYEFLLTPIGTGIAGFTYEEITPLFTDLPGNIKKVGWHEQANDQYNQATLDDLLDSFTTEDDGETMVLHYSQQEPLKRAIEAYVTQRVVEELAEGEKHDPH